MKNVEDREGQRFRKGQGKREGEKRGERGDMNVSLRIYQNVCGREMRFEMSEPEVSLQKSLLITRHTFL